MRSFTHACRTARRAVPAALALALCLGSAALAAKRPPKPPPALGAFTDHLTTFDTTRWMKADGWKNGPPFDNAWLADHIGFSDGLMEIRLDDETALGEPYASGNYQTLGFYGYGCFEASFIPVAEPGAVTSFFTFAGPFDNGGNGKHNEIDIEFIRGETTRFQVNFWANDDTYAPGHEHLVELGFDAAADFHRYGFRWTSGGIEWFVDGEPVYAVANTPADPTPKATDSLQKIMMNLWPVDETAAGWAGTFVYPGEPLYARYDWVRYIEGEDCSLAEPPEAPPPPPPPGDAETMHVGDLALALDSRATQAIARVTVLDWNGQPVSGAAVGGSWAGVITAGDTARETDAAGVATFYSARSRDSGAVSFCVTGVTHPTLNYDTGSNSETCDTVIK